MSSVIALTRFTSQEKARTWPWLGNAGISCMRAGFYRPVDEEAILLFFSVSLLSGSQQEQGGTEVGDEGVPMDSHHLYFRSDPLSGRRPDLWTSVTDILSTSCASISERSCDLERHRNDLKKTAELSSFGRLKEEKLELHHHPQREATAPT
ncbi:hypothetical protein Taro_051064 [Colocasia esculenta]|uniref:Uncharacterized protein n=1 Tax=Colocasia esculenta TaxID=4460 RepID=A0A843XEZ7_COLES|nr:hypothetical protein [Colocasia esculenta]